MTSTPARSLALFLFCAISATLTSLSLGARDGGGHRTKENYIADKVKQMTDLNFRRPLIRLKGEQFKNLVKNAPKNYSVIVMLTALQAQRQCQICQQAHDEFQIIANSWRYSQVRSSLFNGMMTMGMLMVVIVASTFNC